MYGQRARPAGILASSRTNQDLALRLPLSLSLSLCPFLSILLLFLFSLLSLFPLPPKNYRCCCLSPLTFIFLLLFFFFISLLSFSIFSFFFFFFFSAPPFFLIFFPSNFLLCPAPDLHRPTLYPPQAVLEILRCVSWWPQSSIALYLSG